MIAIPFISTYAELPAEGSFEIPAFIDWKADVDLSRQRIESRIAEIRNTLPPEVNITMEKMNHSILSVMGYSLKSHKLSLIELKELALYTTKPHLS
ncbi:MAG TPA: hypothetical protein VIQ00_14105 [Chitinophagaceae bacterium]